MINLKFGLLEKNRERESKLRQIFQEMHQVFNARVFRDKAVLKGGVPARDQLNWIIEATKILSLEDHRTIYVAKKGSFSYFLFKKFCRHGVFLDPVKLDFLSTRGLAMDIINQCYLIGGLSKADIEKIYFEVHRATFGEVYKYSVRDLEPVSSFLGFKKYNWSVTC
jgi:hypothetical protein